jgi:hypothetical protein
MRPIVVGAVLILTALFAQGAEAGGPKPAPGVRPLNSGVHAQSRTVGSSTPNALQPWATSVPRPQNPAFSIEGRQTWATDPRSVFDTQAQGTAPSRRDWRDRDGDGQPDRRPGHDGPRHFKPSTVIVAPGPVYVAPSPCWSAGYWNYQWIPQAYTYNVWLPGQWAPNGAWIDGHYEPRIHQSGYWQPYWVDGRYVAC